MKNFTQIAKLTSAIAMLMLAAACSPTANNADSFHYPASSLHSSGSWSGSNATVAQGNGYFYEYDGI